MSCYSCHRFRPNRRHEFEKPVSARRHVVNRGRSKHFSVKLLAPIGDAVNRRSLPCSTTRPAFHRPCEWCGAAVLAKSAVQFRRESDLEAPPVMLWFKLNKVED